MNEEGKFEVLQYRAQKAIKGSILADHLAHQPIEDYQFVQYDFPNEEILYLKMKDCDEPTLDEGPEPGSRWGMVFDGAVNQYGNGIGPVIITPHGPHISFTARLTFKCTNTMAEYEACIMGLEECIDLRIKHLDVYGDSALVVNQIRVSGKRISLTSFHTEITRGGFRCSLLRSTSIIFLEKRIGWQTLSLHLL